MTLIEFFDANALHFLVPVFSLKPDKLIIIYDERQYSRDRIEFSVKAVRNREPNIPVETININLHHVSEIQTMLEKVVVNEKNENVYMDLTGGDELMTAAGFYVAKQYELTAVYLNRKERKIISAIDLRVLSDAVELTLDEYLVCLGAKQLNNSHMEPDPLMYDNILRMAEATFDDLMSWHALQKFLGNHISNQRMSVTIPEKCVYNEKEYDVRPLLRKFVQYGFLEAKNKNTYQFTSKQSRSYLGIFGIWLELYVYIHLKRTYSRVHFGVVIDWVGYDGKDTVDNEIDVVLMHHSEPILISCKMRKPDPRDVYEIKSLAYNLGGTIGKGVLATTFDVASTMTNPHEIGTRMGLMNVGVIQADDFKKKSTKEIMSAAILPDQFRGRQSMDGM